MIFSGSHKKSAISSNNFRIQSTTTNAGLMDMHPPKRKRLKNQKFTELLQSMVISFLFSCSLINITFNINFQLIMVHTLKQKRLYKN